jgi:hypothetical protein
MKRFFEIFRQTMQNGSRSGSSSETGSPDPAELLRNIIDCRLREFDEFNTMRQLVQNFTELCADVESGWYSCEFIHRLTHVGHKLVAF